MSAKKRTSQKKRVVIWSIIGLVVVIGLGGFLAWRFMEKKPAEQKSHKVATVCSKEQIKKANQLIQSKDSLALSDEVAAIKKQKNYDQDPNCLYAVVQYGFMNNTVDESAVDTLVRLYPKEGLSDGYSPVLTKQQIQGQADSLKEINSSYQEEADEWESDQAKLDQEAMEAVK